MDIKIRAATAADFGGIHALLQQIDRLHAEIHPERFTYAPKGNEQWRNLQLNLEDPNRDMLLAFDEHSLIGLAFLTIERAPDIPIFQPGEWVLLDILTVDEGQRGRGVGKQLLSACQQWAEAKGHKEIQLTVYSGNPARDTYRHWGFQPVKETLKLSW